MGIQPNCALWLSAALAVAAAVGAGCDSGEEPADEKPSIGEQVTAGAEEADEKTGATGIEHGGITSIPDDPELVKKGEKIFNEKGCQACHKMYERQVGPPLAGVTERREPEWIARMIQHPREMLQKDETARDLLKEYGTRMADQNVSPEETRAILAYLGSVPAEEKKPTEEQPDQEQ